MFQIETGIPMPKMARGRTAVMKFPLPQMQPGDSFLIPCDIKDKKEVDSWRRKFLAAKRRVEGTFRSFTVSDGLRVFCVK